MAVEQPITLCQGDDPTYTLTITTRTGLPYDLTGQRVEILIKATRRTPDGDAAAILSSEGADPAITITDIEGGLAIAHFRDLVTYPGSLWYHAYISAVSNRNLNRRTWAYGDLVVNAV